MDDKTKLFINSLGAMTEIWVNIYKNFKAFGLDDKDALVNTQLFYMTVFMNNNEEQEE